MRKNPELQFTSGSCFCLTLYADNSHDRKNHERGLELIEPQFFFFFRSLHFERKREEQDCNIPPIKLIMAYIKPRTSEEL